MAKNTTSAIARQREDVISAGKNPVCVWRHARYVGGQTMKSIATEDGVSLSTVREDIAAVKMFNAMFNEKFVVAGELQMLEQLRELKEKALRGALEAETILRNSESGAEIAREPNIELRLRAVEILNEELSTIVDRHKGPGVAINVNQNQQNNVSASDAGMSFENVLRKVQEKRKKLIELPPAAPLELPKPQENVLDALDELEFEREGVEVEGRTERSLSQ